LRPHNFGANLSLCWALKKKGPFEKKAPWEKCQTPLSIKRGAPSPARMLSPGKIRAFALFKLKAKAQKDPGNKGLKKVKY